MTELRASESLDESLERCGQQGTFGISGIQNAEISRLAQSDAARSRIEESYLKNRTAFFKSFTYKSMPYTMQGVGHLLGGTAGNALCIAGIAGLGLESVHRVADEIGLCGKPEFSSVKLVGNVLQVMGAGLRGMGTYAGFASDVQNSLVAAGSIAVAAGMAISAFPGLPPTSAEVTQSGPAHQQRDFPLSHPSRCGMQGDFAAYTEAGEGANMTIRHVARDHPTPRREIADIVDASYANHPYARTAARSPGLMRSQMSR
ncbi:hypothetical protein OG568_60020 (plasmid) [Streptomyces sp. NBC_01450]|uniref:hypothetical protein n=1 Tax=Streptomyces sp. NBC_01450 TaxID=2903871 RepID=UPI002E34BD8C|nr:hypothetical protein [Streptomyces sp. NBC_01450]